MCSLRAPLLILCTALILATSAVVLAQDQSPAQLSQEDSALLHNANAMTIPQLQEAIHLYQQIGNATMVGQLNNVLAQKSTRQMEDATADPSRADTPEEAPRALLPADQDAAPEDPAADATLKELAKIAALLDDENGGMAAAKSALIELEKHPEYTSPEALILRGRALAQLTRYSEADALLSKMAADSALDAEIHNDAVAALKSCRFEKLAADYDHAARLSNATAMKRIADQLAAIAPTEVTTLDAQCAAYLAIGDPRAVRELLQRHAAVASGNTSLKSHDVRAKTLLGDYESAIASHEAQYADHSLSAADRTDHLIDADQMGDLAAAGFDIGTHFIDDTQGTWWISQFATRSARLADSKWQILGGLRHDATNANDSSLLAPQIDRWNGEVGARYWIADANYFEAALGISDESDASFSGALVRPGISRWGGAVRYDYQAPAQDSLAFRGMNGRENRAAVTFESGLSSSAKFTVIADAFLREVTLDQEKIADGWGLNLALYRVLSEETRSQPRIWAAATTTIGQLSIKQDIVGGSAITDLIDPDVKRHELELGMSKALSPEFVITGSTAGGYDADQENIVWRAGLELNYHFSEDSRIGVGINYDSSGVGANTGKGMTQVTAKYSHRL